MRVHQLLPVELKRVEGVLRLLSPQRFSDVVNKMCSDDDETEEDNNPSDHEHCVDKRRGRIDSRNLRIFCEIGNANSG